jgi:hypothetical protein
MPVASPHDVLAFWFAADQRRPVSSSERRSRPRQHGPRRDPIRPSKKKQRPGTLSHELPGHCERSEAISFGGSVAPGSPRRLAAPRDDTVGFMPRGSAKPVGD